MVPVSYRTPKIRTAKRRVSNLSLGGVRIYSDERLNVGERLELEFFLPDGQSVEAIGKVVWMREMPPDAEAVFDIGMEFMELGEAAIKKLKTVLK
jgi:hypothetical protein